MEITKSGSCRIFYQGAVRQAAWTYSGDYTVDIMLPNENSQFATTDFEDRLGFNYNAGDDGTIYNPFVMLRDDEPDPVDIPSEGEFRAAMLKGMKPIYESVVAGDTHSEDLSFCRDLFQHPACMLRAYQKTGSIEAAQKYILKNIFGLRV